MTNTFIVLLDICMILSTLLLFLSVLRVRSSAFLLLDFVAFCGILLLWLVCDALWHVLPAGPAPLFFLRLQATVSAFIPLPLFHMAGSYRGAGRPPRRKVVVLLATVPAISCVLIWLPALESLYLSGLAPVFNAPYRTLVLRAGPWYYVQAIYGSVLVLAAAAVILYSFHRLDSRTKNSARLMLTALAIFEVGLLIGIAGFNHIPLDTALIGAGLSLPFIYLANIGREEDESRIQRREVFNYLDEAVFILDKSNKMIDANRPALKWLEMVDLPYAHAPFDTMIQNAQSAGKLRIKPGDDKTGEDIFLLNANFPFFYHMVRGRNAEEDEASSGGSYVTLTDVTHNRLLIERLRETAGVDTLTGLPNRYRYQELLRLLDVPESLPLSIIIGDVNGLKEINDRHGHRMGDRIIEITGEILKAHCPPDGFAARIGGDEFAMLLPRHNRIAATGIINGIQGAVQSVHGLPVVPSLALGSATKYKPEENLNILVARADKSMYSNKS